MFLNRIVARLSKLTSQSAIWPPIDDELLEWKNRGFLKGKVLNAGAGSREIGHLIDGELVNQDIRWPGDARTNIQIFSPIHEIPRGDETFDAIVCIAVLEHVENPEEVIPEFFRVLKPGGVVIATIPFLQPEHKVPTDFQRYTRDGIVRLFACRGFEVIESRPLFTVYHTLHWLVYEWLHLKSTFAYRAMRWTLLPILAHRAKHSRTQSDVLASGFQVVARKPVAGR